MAKIRLSRIKSSTFKNSSYAGLSVYVVQAHVNLVSLRTFPSLQLNPLDCTIILILEYLLSL